MQAGGAKHIFRSEKPRTRLEECDLIVKIASLACSVLKFNNFLISAVKIMAILFEFIHNFEALNNKTEHII